jgi:tRNA(Met) cytidine acetyltransferase
LCESALSAFYVARMRSGADAILSPEARAALSGLVGRLRRDARRASQRRALVLAGDPAWGLAAARAALAALPAPVDSVWLSDRPLPEPHSPLSAGTGLLGREIDALAYDAHGGFDPDAFGAAVGALRGGGLLLLLTPPLDLWPELTDPQAARVAVHPFRAEQVPGRFLRRLARVLAEGTAVALVRQGRPILGPEDTEGTGTPQIGSAAWRPSPDPDCRTPDQAAAVSAVLRVARGRPRRPLVITSDRGRGKSSALGIAAGRLLAEGGYRILVTAPRHAAVEPLFRHAARLLPGAEIHADRILRADGAIELHPPDALALVPTEADLLLVDEAAGIPAPLLERLLAAYGRVVFATTVHGYEGTGRGFEVRFRRTLDRLSPGWRRIELSEPIRWAADDPLERLVARALLLDAAPAPGAALAGADPGTCRYARLDREALWADEETLQQLFGLLVLAHYQTRPLDLRHLLDGPNLRVHVLRHGAAVAATALVAVEGRLDAALGLQVFAGERRPRGHLLPQTLSAHAGLDAATGLGFARIVRIATHPAVQGRGIGRMLVERIIEEAAADGLDLAGASFGATPDLLRFWERCGFPAAHLGTSRNAASGAHAAVVLRALSPGGEALLDSARARLTARLPILLAGPLRSLETDVAAVLLANAPTAPAPAVPVGERRELETFAFARRPYEAALPAIAALLGARLPAGLRAERLDERERTALIAKVLQQQEWREVAQVAGASGRAGVIALLRSGVGRLLAMGNEDSG